MRQEPAPLSEKLANHLDKSGSAPLYCPARAQGEWGSRRKLTNNLVYVKGRSATETEVSRVATLQGQTRYAYNVLITSTNLGLGSVDLELQYSYDLDNWTAVMGSALNVAAFPTNVTVDNIAYTAATLPGVHVRLRYTFNGGTGAAAVIQATIGQKAGSSSCIPPTD